jgi:hypothetical protein
MAKRELLIPIHILGALALNVKAALIVENA